MKSILSAPSVNPRKTEEQKRRAHESYIRSLNGMSVCPMRGKPQPENSPPSEEVQDKSDFSNHLPSSSRSLALFGLLLIGILFLPGSLKAEGELLSLINTENDNHFTTTIPEVKWVYRTGSTVVLGIGPLTVSFVPDTEPDSFMMTEAELARAIVMAISSDLAGQPNPSDDEYGKALLMIREDSKADAVKLRWASIVVRATRLIYCKKINFVPQM